MLESLINTEVRTTAIGQVEFITPGTYSWTVPTGVYDISGVVISAGGRTMGGAGYSVAGGTGGGGGLCWFSKLEVKPGDVFTIVVGDTPVSQTNVANLHGQNSRVAKNGVNLIEVQGGRGGRSGIGGAGGYTLLALAPVVGGGSGGAGGVLAAGRKGDSNFFGGGAGGYSGNGGKAMDAMVGGQYTEGTSGSGGGGAGASEWMMSGGVCIYGQGASGTYIAYSAPQINNLPESYVGHVGSPLSGVTTKTQGHYGSGARAGAVRIIWGEGRSYPSTRTRNEL